MRMRVADYLTDALYRAGGETIFLVTGGMIMHLTDALLVHPAQKWISCHHEQAAVMAADAYGRLTNKLGVAYVTAGPGALNTLTGVVGAYIDTAPVIIVAGQSKVSQAKITGPRQFALQGFNTLPLMEQVTKYAVMLDDVATVRSSVEHAIWEATHGRVGPAWIECPVDLQGTMFDPEEYPGFVPPDSELATQSELAAAVARVAEALKSSQRPLILAGAGVRAAGAVDDLLGLVHRVGIPVVTSRLGMDLIGFEDPLFVGRPGTYGDRPANFAVQNCDLLLTIGCRMALGLVGYDFESFAPNALKIMVDVDELELDKPSVVPDIPIHADAAEFLRFLRSSLGDWSLENHAWVTRTQKWKKRYPVDLPEYKTETEGVNSYHFTRMLSDQLGPDAICVLDTGSCFHVWAQAFRVKEGQRHIITGGLSTMGYMPAVMGAASAADGHEVYCVTGDGSIQMNLQELQTIRHNNFPVKLVVFNNNGYLLIRHTQGNFMDGRLIGEGPETGVSFPAFEDVASTYGMRYMRIDSESGLEAGIAQLVASEGPIICEVMTPSRQLLIPRVASKQLEDGTMISMLYDDMFPFLDRDEYEENQARD
ncbi:MAG: thiamine pyrophosphate-binding protein [Coriobacteriia bacterium]|nr:thiamine pyrophosphate-binding protein [Coriobacteriia bacterium]